MKMLLARSPPRLLHFAGFVAYASESRSERVSNLICEVGLPSSFLLITESDAVFMSLILCLGNRERVHVSAAVRPDCRAASACTVHVVHVVFICSNHNRMESQVKFPSSIKHSWSFAAKQRCGFLLNKRRRCFKH